MSLDDCGRHVGDDTIDGVRVSTVYLAIDHSFGGRPPLWYETMIFGGDYDGEQQRYTTEEQAQAGHAAWVAKVKQSQQGGSK